MLRFLSQGLESFQSTLKLQVIVTLQIGANNKMELSAQTRSMTVRLLHFQMKFGIILVPAFISIIVKHQTRIICTNWPGLLLGSALVGLTSDRFGRRPVLLAMIITSILTTVAGAFCRGYWSYVTTRLLAGLAAQGLFILGFSLSIEIVGSQERLPGLTWVSYKNLIANFVHLPFALGQAVLTMMAYFLNDWR